MMNWLLALRKPRPRMGLSESWSVEIGFGKGITGELCVHLHFNATRKSTCRKTVRRENKLDKGISIAGIRSIGAGRGFSLWHVLAVLLFLRRWLLSPTISSPKPVKS
jgi:hypothetical protein